MQDQINDIARRMTEMEVRQQEHLELSQSVQTLAQTTADNTREVVELMAAFKGAFIVLNFIGKAAKPVLWITAAIAGLALAWAEFRGLRK